MTEPVPAGPADVSALHALHEPLFDPPWTLESLAGQMAAAGCATLAIWGPEGADGFVLLRTAADEAEVLILAVDPARRRRGLGGVLLEHALRLAAASGAAVMWLEVAVDNAAALALYRRAGFEEAGRRPRYYGRRDGAEVDALVLRRALPASAP